MTSNVEMKLDIQINLDFQIQLNAKSTQMYKFFFFKKGGKLNKTSYQKRREKRNTPTR